MKYIYLLIPGGIFAMVLQIFGNTGRKKWAIVFKFLASAMFVLLCVLSGRHCSKPLFFRYVLLAQIFGAAGDVVLAVRHSLRRKSVYFYIGGSLFYIGHLFFIIAFLNRTGDRMDLLKYIISAVIVDLIIAVIMDTMIRSYTHKSYRVLCCGYIITIATAVVFSFGTFIAEVFSLGNLLFMIGSAGFLSSDMILITNEMKPKKKRLAGDILIALYYGGQFFIALSLQAI